MALPDVNQWTPQEWDQILAAIQQAKVTKELLRQKEAEALKAGIIGSVGAIDALIGPENPSVPGFDSIRELKMFTRQQKNDNAGWAIEMILEYMEKMALVIRDIAENENN